MLFVFASNEQVSRSTRLQGSSPEHSAATPQRASQIFIFVIIDQYFYGGGAKKKHAVAFGTCILAHALVQAYVAHA